MVQSDYAVIYWYCLTGENIKLSPAQFTKGELFLHENEDLFATLNYDLGRTHVVKHKINTEQGTRPIKHRRIRLHLSREVDKQVNKMVEKDGKKHL